MKIKIKANSIYKRLQIWNGIFNLTKKELEVISAFIKVNIDSKDDNEQFPFVIVVVQDSKGKLLGIDLDEILYE